MFQHVLCSTSFTFHNLGGRGYADESLWPLFTSCIFYCVQIVGSFLSVIVFYFVPTLEITDAAFVIKKPNQEHILCDQSLMFFVEYLRHLWKPFDLLYAVLCSVQSHLLICGNSYWKCTHFLLFYWQNLLIKVSHYWRRSYFGCFSYWHFPFSVQNCVDTV